MNLHTIILAAGEGSRMKSKKAKSLQRIGGCSMLELICQTAGGLSSKISVIVGFDKESIIKEVKDYGLNISTCEQKKQLGTGDAVKCGIEDVEDADKVLVLYGDVPLIKRASLKDLISKSDDSLTILSTTLDDPYGYGRVKKDNNDNIIGIIEEKDASDQDKKINEIFTGVLCCSKNLLKEAIYEIKNDNASGEYYLTDIVSIISKKGFKINSCIVPNHEVKGANTKKELSELEEIFRKMKADDLLELGITISDPSRIDVRGDISAGTDCSIDVNVILEGNIKLGDNVSIGPNTLLKDVEIGDNTVIEAFSHLVSSKIGNNCNIGPYARLREGSFIDDGAKIGNFVETKKTTIGKKSKANHFSYLGDAEIGEDTNIGAGSITCNYDGKEKHQTKIGNKSFIGTNSSIVAPVNIGSNTYIAAGSVITKDVPDDSLGVSRSKQNNIEDWSKKEK